METYSPFKLDDFWNDCIDTNNAFSLKSKNQEKINNYKYKPLKTNNNNTRLRNPNQNNLFKNKTNIYYSSVEKIYKKLNQKYPELFYKKSNNINNKKKIENSFLKSIILYEEGLAKKQLIEKNMKDNYKNQINKELSLCTFRPKISKRKNEDEYNNPVYKRLYERDLSKNQKCKRLHKSMEFINKNKLINIESENENNFRKMKEKSNKSKRIHNNKSESFFTKKENAEFILRYTKARDEKMIKRFKKLYRKDDSYDYYLNTLTSRVGNNEYKNSLNVNNIIPLYGETVSRNNFANSQIGEFKGLSFDEDTHIKHKNKDKKLIMNDIRKGLMEINLNFKNDF